MKRRAILVAIACTLTLSGCMSVGGRGSRLLPWNWFASDSTAKVQKAQAKIDGADAGLRADAHRNAYATQKAIAAEKARQLTAGGVSRELETAADYADRTVADLDLSEGVLAFNVQAELKRIVVLRNSQVEAERARGDKALAAADRIAGNSATEKIEGQKQLAAAHAKIGQEQQRALVAEEKYNREHFIFWAVIIGGLVLWLAGQVTTRLAKTNPFFAPIAAGFNMVAAPALHGSWQKISDVTERVGNFMADVRTKAPEVADKIEQLLDGAMVDKHLQQQVAAAATAAGAPPK